MKQSTVVAALFDSAATFRSGLPEKLAFVLLNVLDLAKASGLGRENTNALVKMFEQISKVEVRGTI